MNKRYIVTTERITNPDIGEYVTHGIAAVNTRDYVRDVSTSLETVERMARSFNRGALSPTHLLDAVRDAISQ
jgi:hypothetical protein